ncbi:golgin subfamily A member 6-like protein 24 [Palaemon carinicauda]|uniref:golgin subfamily A member 6-like protein 24 n=1 Tax=Palaemon carinicauda TaxID=392227 RepID=UPI0035B5EAC8
MAVNIMYVMNFMSYLVLSLEKARIGILFFMKALCRPPEEAQERIKMLKPLKSMGNESGKKCVEGKKWIETLKGDELQKEKQEILRRWSQTLPRMERKREDDFPLTGGRNGKSPWSPIREANLKPPIQENYRPERAVPKTAQRSIEEGIKNMRKEQQKDEVISHLSEAILHLARKQQDHRQEELRSSSSLVDVLQKIEVSQATLKEISLKIDDNTDFLRKALSERDVRITNLEKTVAMLCVESRRKDDIITDMLEKNATKDDIMLEQECKIVNLNNKVEKLEDEIRRIDDAFQNMVEKVDRLTDQIRKTEKSAMKESIQLQEKRVENKNDSISLERMGVKIKYECVQTCCKSMIRK